MGRYKLIVQMDAAEGKEDEFRDYYPNTHVNDVLTVPGVLSAQLLRRKATMSDSGKHFWEYMVIYEIECDDPDALTAEIRSRAAAGDIRGNPGLMKSERRAIYYEAASPEMPGTPPKR